MINVRKEEAKRKKKKGGMDTGDKKRKRERILKLERE